MKTRIASTTWAAFVFCMIVFFAGFANAAGLTPQQSATLAADITAASEFNAIPHNESRLGMFDCSRANIRSGIDATWVGTSADLAVRATVYTHCKRLATRVEKLFATGTGTDATPGLLVFEGTINYRDVADAMSW